MPEFVLTPEITGRAERVFLNPEEVATEDRIERNLHSGNIQVREEGIDWGQQEINAFMVQRAIGAIPIDSDLPNRIITIPLSLGLVGDFDEARIALQAEVGRINEEGGWLKRELIGGTYGEAGSHLFADLVKATLKLGDGTPQATDGVDPEAELILEALPDFYGDVIEEKAFEGTGDGSKTFQIRGNLPARVDLTVTDKSGHDQLGLAYHLRARNYDSAETAKCAYEAEKLEPLGAASEGSLTGASGGKVVRIPSALGREWNPILGTNFSGSYLTHAGLYDVYARVYTTSGSLPWVRLIYRVGDNIGSVAENVATRIPMTSQFCLVSLGQVNLCKGPVGPHRWRGVIQGRGELGFENVSIDRLFFFSADESSGIAKAPLSFLPGLVGFKARDEFLQGEGNLAGKTLGIGGTWSGEGAEGDFTLDTENDRVVRTAVSDSGIGRLEIAGTTELTNTLLTSDMMRSANMTVNGTLHQGVIARYINKENFLRLDLISVLNGSSPELRLIKRVAGVETTLGLLEQGYVTNPVNTMQRLALLVKANGEYVVWCFPATLGAGSPAFAGSDTALAEAGSLAKGKIGLYDYRTTSAAVTRTYDNFSAWEPQTDAVVFANESARLTSTGIARLSPDGLAYAGVQYPSSDLPRVPVSGLEERPMELAIKISRGDFAYLPDTGLDKFSAQLSYSPCWSGVPES